MQKIFYIILNLWKKSFNNIFYLNFFKLFYMDHFEILYIFNIKNMCRSTTIWNKLFYMYMYNVLCIPVKELFSVCSFPS